MKKKKVTVKEHVYNVYCISGVEAAIEVYDKLTEHKGAYEYCDGCAAQMPSQKHTCLICGQKTREQKKLKTFKLVVRREWYKTVEIEIEAKSCADAKLQFYGTDTYRDEVSLKIVDEDPCMTEDIVESMEEVEK